MSSDLTERLATLDAENRLRDEPVPLAARWWELNGLVRESLTRWTPVAVGARVVRRGDDGRLVVEGGVRIGPDTGRDMEGCRAAASLAAEWFEEGVAPFTKADRVALAVEDADDTVHLMIRYTLEEVASVQDALTDLFETERAIAHALGFTPTIVSRPPWT
ncbi:MAG TPA: hypothetical protein VFY20_13110 [Gemmatimonadales bacterium]|nr:hypothetical protein [Gemmatimonadales bacterium]